VNFWQWTYYQLAKIIRDTLQKPVNGVYKWDRMKLMMFFSFNTALGMAIVDFCNNGLRIDVWSVLIGFAFGTKIINAHASKIEKSKDIE